MNVGGAYMQLDLGQKIRELRRRDGRTQEALAEAIVLAGGFVCAYDDAVFYTEGAMGYQIQHSGGIVYLFHDFPPHGIFCAFFEKNSSLFFDNFLPYHILTKKLENIKENP